MLRRGLVWAASLALVAGACGGGSDKAEEIDRNEEVPIELSIKLSGDLEATYEQKVVSRFVVVRTNDKDLQDAQVMGLEPVEPIRLGPAAFLAGFGVSPFEGDGTYTIKVGSPMDAIKAQQEGGDPPKEKSSIKIDWWPTGDVQAGPETYMRRAKPCTVKIENKGTRGTVTCPDVTNETKDKHFSFELRWSAPTTPAPTTTTVAETSSTSTP